MFFMFKKLLVGTLATGIMLSGGIAASAAELEQPSTNKALHSTCPNNNTTWNDNYVTRVYDNPDDVKSSIIYNGKTLYHIPALDYCSPVGVIAHYA